MVISLNTQKEPEKITSTKELAEYIRKSVMEDNELSDEEKDKFATELINKKEVAFTYEFKKFSTSISPAFNTASLAALLIISTIGFIKKSNSLILL